MTTNELKELERLREFVAVCKAAFEVKDYYRQRPGTAIEEYIRDALTELKDMPEGDAVNSLNDSEVCEKVIELCPHFRRQEDWLITKTASIISDENFQILHIDSARALLKAQPPTPAPVQAEPAEETVPKWALDSQIEITNQLRAFTEHMQAVVIPGLVAKRDAEKWARPIMDTTPQPAPASVVPQWQPIATAPKDGTKVLLATKSCMSDGEHSGTCWVWPYINRDPTHWMPLPAAPKQGDAP
jgi:hypothetical protein